MNKLDMESKKIIDENVAKVGNIFPNAVVETEKGFEIDFNVLKQELSNVIVDDTKEKYQLTWPGKKNSILNANTPSKNTLRPVKEKSVEFDNTENIYIEGDNLEALKILQESYLNKIKCIYIDPPYNTGNDFIYNDYFNKDRNKELLESGQIDEAGNRLVANNQSNGRYHSDWLSMMYPRLKLSRNLLSDNGVIYISISDAEGDNLKKICDEIFGENNFIAKIVWTNNEGGGSSDSKFFKVKHEYILCYAKNIEKLNEINGIPIEDVDRYKLSDEFEKTRGKYQLVKLASASLQYSQSLDYNVFAPDGTEIYPRDNTDKNKAIWRWSKQKLDWGVKNGFIEWKKDKNGIWQIYTKQYTNCDKDGNLLERTKKPLGFINRFSSTQGSNELFNLFKIKTFSYPKPIELIKYLVERFSVENDDIILDFFAGSSTTAHSILKLNAEDGVNRKYIMVQLPESISDKSEAKINGYNTICDIGEERIRKAIKQIKEETDAKIDYGFRVYKIDSSNMKDVYYNPTSVEQSQLNLFESNIKEDRKNDDLLIQTMLDLGLTLDLKIEEKIINENKVFFVEYNALVACFDDNIKIDIIDEICKYNPMKIIFKDSSFKNDNDKINITERIKKLSPDTELSVL